MLVRFRIRPGSTAGTGRAAHRRVTGGLQANARAERVRNVDAHRAIDRTSFELRAVPDLACQIERNRSILSDQVDFAATAVKRDRTVGRVNFHHAGAVTNGYRTVASSIRRWWGRWKKIAPRYD